MSDQIFIMPEFSSRWLHPKGWGSVKPVVHTSHDNQYWRFYSQVCDLLDHVEYGSDLHIFVQSQINKAGWVAENADHGHLHEAAANLADIVSDCMDWQTRNGKDAISNKVIDLCQMYAIVFDEYQNGQVDVDRPGLF